MTADIPPSNKPVNMPHIDRPVGKIISIIAAVLLGAYVFYSVATDKPAESDEPSIARGEAWNLCKQTVEDDLKNPTSADFRLLSTDFAETTDGGWSIAGSLTAVNDFGVEQEIGFSCKVDPDGFTVAQLAAP